MANLKTTLCWYCVNAVPGIETGCSWSRELRPVDGWRATETQHLYDGKPKTSALVHWCPEYRKEDRNAVN